MSDDPEGVLFYGYNWKYDELEELDGEYPEFDIDPVVDDLMAERGQTGFPHYGANREQRTEDEKRELDQWRANVSKAKADVGVDFGHQGTWDYAGRYLYVLGSQIKAEWGDTQPVEQTLTVGADWRYKLDAALDHLGIDKPVGPNQPGWWLTSFYG